MCEKKQRADLTIIRVFDSCVLLKKMNSENFTKQKCSSSEISDWQTITFPFSYGQTETQKDDAI